jgi:hypothetical protein
MSHLLRSRATCFADAKCRAEPRTRLVRGETSECKCSPNPTATSDTTTTTTACFILCIELVFAMFEMHRGLARASPGLERQDSERSPFVAQDSQGDVRVDAESFSTTDAAEPFALEPPVIQLRRVVCNDDLLGRRPHPRGGASQVRLKDGRRGHALVAQKAVGRLERCVISHHRGKATTGRMHEGRCQMNQPLGQPPVFQVRTLKTLRRSPKRRSARASSTSPVGTASWYG